MSASGPVPRKRPEKGDRCYESMTGCRGELVWTPLPDDRNHLILHCNACGRHYSENVIGEESDDELASALDDVSMSEDEQEELNWRLDMLLKAGYSHDVAVVLAFDKEVDLHQAVELFKRDGERTSCTEELALQILL